MSILFLGTSSVDGNASQQKVYFLSAALETKGWKIATALHDFPANRKLADRLGLADVRWLPWTGAAADFRRKQTLIRSHSWDAVQSVGIGIRTLQTKVGGVRRPKVFYDFDERVSSIRALGRMRGIYHRLVETWMCRQGDGFTCASEYLLNWLRRARPELSQELLYLPVAISPLEHQEDSAIIAEIRNRFGDQQVATYLGMLCPIYRDQMEEVLDLARAWRGREANRVVWILGGGEDLEYWRQRVREERLESLVIFEGFVARDRIASYLASSAILVFPFAPTEQNLSRCPTKAYHYAASGRPLVTNRVGEVGRLFGSSAHYYEPGDGPGMLAAADRALASVTSGGPRVDFRQLTWEARAETYSQWLENMGVRRDSN